MSVRLKRDDLIPEKRQFNETEHQTSPPGQILLHNKLHGKVILDGPRHFKLRCFSRVGLLDSPPDGGVVASLQVLTGCCVCVTTWRLSGSFDSSQEYYPSHHESIGALIQQSILMSMLAGSDLYPLIVNLFT